MWNRTSSNLGIMATIRPATPTDMGFLAHMLRLIAGEPGKPRTLEECRADPRIACYVDGWSPDQLGVICMDADARIGAAWLRQFTPSDQSRGFVSPTIPELSLALVPEYQGRGRGAYLRDAFLALAQRHGVNSISAAARRDAPGLQRFLAVGGFSPVSEGKTDITYLHVCQ